MEAKDYGEILPLFITVDPLREGVKEVAEYVKEFHPELIRLTEEQIKDACKGFKVYHSAGKSLFRSMVLVRGCFFQGQKTRIRITPWTTPSSSI